jgi:hypothetical protein
MTLLNKVHAGKTAAPFRCKRTLRFLPNQEDLEEGFFTAHAHSDRLFYKDIPLLQQPTVWWLMELRMHH